MLGFRSLQLIPRLLRHRLTFSDVEEVFEQQSDIDRARYHDVLVLDDDLFVIERGLVASRTLSVVYLVPSLPLDIGMTARALPIAKQGTRSVLLEHACKVVLNRVTKRKGKGTPRPDRLRVNRFVHPVRQRNLANAPIE